MSNKLLPFRNLLFGVGIYLLLHYGHYEVPTQVAVLFAITASFLLYLHTALSGLTTFLSDFRPKLIPEAFRGELVIEPNFKRLMEHEAFKDYYTEALPIYEEKGKEKLPVEHPFYKSLWSQFSFNFVFIGGHVWSDFHKTFTNQINFSGKILNYDLSENRKEPTLKGYISDGVLRIYLEDGTAIFRKDGSHKICEFPLYIFEEIPIQFLEFHKLFGEEWNNYIEIKKGLQPRLSWLGKWDLSEKASNQSLKKVLSSLEFYGFKQFSEGTLDAYTDREGNTRAYDPNDGFRQYKNDYLTVKFKELND